MKIQLLSDIHLEYYEKYPGIEFFIEPLTAILILAGDICYYNHKHFIPFFEEVSSKFEYVVFVPGNHEYYMKSIIDLTFDSFKQVDSIMKERLKRFKNVYFLQKDTLVINNIRIIGTTLWYENFEKDKLNYIAPTQNDKFILYNNHLMPDPVTIDNINKEQYRWLEHELKSNKSYHTIVITHYLPSKLCIANKYKNSSDNFLFVTNCESLFKYTNYWFYGHTHIGKKMIVGQTSVISNPYGLPCEQYKYKKNINGIIDIPFFALM